MNFEHSNEVYLRAWLAEFGTVSRARVNLYRANLRGANLRGLNLSLVSMWRADLRDADLCGATLFKAELFGSNLKGANLTGADLHLAGLASVDLTATTGVLAVHELGRHGRTAYFVDYGYIIMVYTGCFAGTITQLLDQSARVHGRGSAYNRGYIDAVKQAKAKFRQEN